MSSVYAVEINLDDGTVNVRVYPSRCVTCAGRGTIPAGDVPKVLAQAIAALDVAGPGQYVDGLGYKDYSAQVGNFQWYNVRLNGAKASATTRALMRLMEEKDG